MKSCNGITATSKCMQESTEALIMEEQVVRLLIDKADATEKVLSFDEAMNG